MERAFAHSRYIILVGVAGLLIAAIGAFVVSFAEAILLVARIVQNLTQLHELEIQEVEYIKLIDGFLVATGLLIFSFGLYELFIRRLDLPRFLMFANLHELKATLANILVLTLAVTFLYILQEGDDPVAVIYKGVGTAAVMGVLIWFARSGGDEHGEKE